MPATLTRPGAAPVTAVLPAVVTSCDDGRVVALRCRLDHAERSSSMTVPPGAALLLDVDAGDLDGSLGGRVDRVTWRHGASRAWVCIDTMAAVQDEARVAGVAAALGEAGVAVVLRGFAGLGTVGFLRRVPVGVLVLESELLDRLGVDRDVDSLVLAVASLADAFGVGVVAEPTHDRSRSRLCDLGVGLRQH